MDSHALECLLSVYNGFTSWPLLGGNQVGKKKRGAWLGRCPGWEVTRLGRGGGMKLWLCGSWCGARDQIGGGAAEESRCSLAFTLLAASVTGPLSYYGQLAFGVCVCRRPSCTDERTLFLSLLFLFFPLLSFIQLPFPESSVVLCYHVCTCNCVSLLMSGVLSRLPLSSPSACQSRLPWPAMWSKQEHLSLTSRSL